VRGCAIERGQRSYHYPEYARNEIHGKRYCHCMQADKPDLDNGPRSVLLLLCDYVVYCVTSCYIGPFA
jgi:hypothetical protein